jgi:UDP:flavonoid glycosyltransferase YjiC (YdhE family)/catechol 2,3-dioxygenase-like lactoylglutathione lyase family enzyme
MYGHVNTILPLALAAKRAGHTVAFATGPDLVDHVRRRDIDAWPVGPTHAEAGGRAALSVEYFITGAQKRALDLVPRAVAWRPDVVVHEEVELAGSVAAAATGAREIVHGLGRRPGAELWEAFAPAIGGLFREWAISAAADTVRDALHLDLCPPAVAPAGPPLWRSSLPIRPDPGLPAAGEELPAAVAALPHDRTVHVTLGTVFHQAAGVLEAAIEGLRTLAVNVVATVGPDVDPARFGAQPEHVLIAGYLPHALLLPRCDVVVSHGGAGIMLGALAAGLPQLVLPQGADQFANAAAAEAAGTALVLEPGTVKPGSVATAVRRLLDEPAFADAAAAVRAQIAAMPAADAVVAAVVEPQPMSRGLLGLAQVKLPVAHLARSIRWYRDLLDLRLWTEFLEDGVVRGAGLIDPDGRFGIALRDRAACANEPDLRGFDVVALRPRSAGVLDKLVERCASLGVAHGGIRHRPGGAWLDIPDPDGTVLRFYHFTDPTDRFTGVELRDGQPVGTYDSPISTRPITESPCATT